MRFIALATLSVLPLVAAQSTNPEQAPLRLPQERKTQPSFVEEPVGWYDPRDHGGRLLDVRPVGHGHVPVI
jgi:hypothetical protein